MRVLPLLLVAGVVAAQAPVPVFRSDINLQSVAVRVRDRAGNDISSLIAADFVIRENGQPKPVAFFESGNGPMSVAILLDSSASMEMRGELGRV